MSFDSHIQQQRSPLLGEIVLPPFRRNPIEATLATLAAGESVSIAADGRHQRGHVAPLTGEVLRIRHASQQQPRGTWYELTPTAMHDIGILDDFLERFQLSEPLILRNGYTVLFDDQMFRLPPNDHDLRSSFRPIAAALRLGEPVTLLCEANATYSGRAPYGVVAIHTDKGGRTSNDDGVFAQTLATGKFFLGTIDAVGSNWNGSDACRIIGSAIPARLERGDSIPDVLQDGPLLLQKCYEAGIGEKNMAVCVALAEISANHLRAWRVGDCRTLQVRIERDSGRARVVHETIDESNVQRSLTERTRNARPDEIAIHTGTHGQSVFNWIGLDHGVADRCTITRAPIWRLLPNDRVIVVSDGITNYIDSQMIADLVMSAATPAEAVESIIEAVLLAHQRLGIYGVFDRDNLSVEVYFHEALAF